MKKVLLSLLIVTLLAVTGLAQSMCRVSVTFSGLRGPDKNATLTIFRVLVNGSIYSNKTNIFRTNDSGVLLGADNQPGVQLPQGAVVWLYANAAAVPLVGLDFNPNGGTPFQVPNKLTATIYELQGATTLLRAQGDMIYGGVDGLPARLPAGANGRCLVMVSGIPAWAICPGGGGGGSSVWGNITGNLPDQTDLQTALNLKANTSALAAVALSGAYNDLTGKPTLGTAAALNVAASGNAASGEIVKGDDTRLTDARTPTSHTHASTDISDSTVAGRALLTDTNAAAQRASLGLGTAAVLNVAASGNAASGEVVKGDDTRLSDARTPSAHTHAAADTISGAFDVARIPDLSAIYSVLAHTHTFASLTSKPTTLSGYGITDAQGLDQDLTDIAALTANGLLRRSGGIWAMDSASYLTGNQAITLSGDLSGSGATSISAIIGNNVVSDTKIRQSAGLSILGRSANTTGNIADITAANDGEVLRRSGSAIGFGTITTAGIGANQVTNAKLAQVATATFKGRTTAGTGDPEDLTATQATVLLNAFVGDSGSGGTKGLVPAPATGDATKFLRGDGVFATVSASTSFANPTASIGLTPVNGSASTAMRSDAAPPLDVSIAPTMTGAWVFNNTISQSSTSATAFRSGASASTPGFLVNNSTASQASGISVTGKADGTAPELKTISRTQITTALAGNGLAITADPAIAGSSSAGAAAGGNVTITSGDAARLTSGNADGGEIKLIGGTPVGTGKYGSVWIRKPNVTGQDAWAPLKFRAPQNETSTRFVSFYGPDETTEQGYIASNSGNTGLTIQTTKLIVGSGVDGLIQANYTSTGGLYDLNNTLALGSAKALCWTGSQPYQSVEGCLRRAAIATLSISGSSSTTAATLSTPALTPSQISSDQNNYAPGAGWFIRLSSDASRNLTGLVAGADGQIAEIWNVGSNNIVIQDESSTTASSAANRFLTSTAADLTLTPKKCAELRYDGTSARWRVRLCN